MTKDEAKIVVDAAVRSCAAEALAYPKSNLSIYGLTGRLLAEMSAHDPELFMAIHFDTHEAVCCDIAARHFIKQRGQKPSGRTVDPIERDARRNAIMRDGERLMRLHAQLSKR